jgi:plastocyanin
VKWWSILFYLMLSSAGAQPHREVSIIVTPEGYYPQSVTVFQGEVVKFYVTSTIETPDCFLLQGHEVFLAANKGKVTEAQTKFQHPGVYNYYCPSTKHQGKVTVMQKYAPKTEPVRKVASENDPALWVPKEYE